MEQSYHGNLNLNDMAEKVANDLNLKVMSPSSVVDAMETNSLYNSTDDENVVYRKIAGVSVDENIFLKRHSGWKINFF